MILSVKPIYSFLDMITFGQGFNKTVNGVAIKLPAKYAGSFPSGPEKENFNFLRSCCGEGATILDIGAHVGLFSVMAAKIAGEYGKIFAFEPSAANFQSLQQTIRINQLEKFVHPVNQAMGSENEQSSEANTIDNFVITKKLSKINFINIDVEGMEYDTLLGGVQVFKKYKPHVIIAIHPALIEKKGQRLEDIYDLLDELRYTIVYKGNYISKEQFCSNKQVLNLHLVPQ